MKAIADLIREEVDRFNQTRNTSSEISFGFKDDIVSVAIQLNGLSKKASVLPANEAGVILRVIDSKSFEDRTFAVSYSGNKIFFRSPDGQIYPEGLFADLVVRSIQ